MKKHHGAAMVEFAVAALLFFIVLFGVVEFGRFFFVYNTLVEASRRGARTAAVCPPNNINGSTAKITNVVLFNTPSDTSGNGILGLSAANVNIEYLLDDMSTWTYSPDTYGGVVTGNIDDIKFVRVSINGFQHTVIIPLPFFNSPFTIPTTATTTTLPSESLGRMTADNPLAAASRNCF